MYKKVFAAMGIFVLLMFMWGCDSLKPEKAIIFNHEFFSNELGYTSYFTVVIPAQGGDFPAVFLLNDTDAPPEAWLGLENLKDMAYDYSLILILIAGKLSDDDNISPTYYLNYIDEVVAEVNNMDLPINNRKGIISLANSAYFGLYYGLTHNNVVQSISLLDPIISSNTFQNNTDMFSESKVFFDVASNNDNSATITAIADSLTNHNYTHSDDVNDANEVNYIYQTDEDSDGGFYFWIDNVKDHFLFQHKVLYHYDIKTE